MSDTGCCPYCGSPIRGVAGPGAAGSAALAIQDPGPTVRGLEPLYREVRRIREIAEARVPDDDARRIAELTRQVQELRATVARLRGPGVAGTRYTSPVN